MTSHSYAPLGDSPGYADPVDPADIPPPFDTPDVRHLAPYRPGSLPAVGSDPYGDDSAPADRPRTVHLSTPCARLDCEHTLNWHTGKHGCIARGGACSCPAFQPPAAD
ncbi:hypothetical protein OG497_37810 [Streptomyces sp. NBC_01242]|uniref:hypothetical protein n=1 Tax=Streptomyces sp. NBC_01242 TaxID=2903795 RepID=UPI0022535C4B|nr:hypothetical protein [Streptomyces sp. NBC_01242]MCX4799615.1 hypothetical protein [Streptomyces sp. NBC_01242]